MERTSTWENIGTDFIKGVTKLDESGIPAEMAFSVSKVPMGWSDENGIFHRVVGTSTVLNDVTKHAYGPVSDAYAAISNSEALGVLQYIDGMDIVKYGSTHTGMQYIIGKLDDIDVLGDKVTPYLLFRNSFDGKYPIQVAICPLRIVCQNQLTMAFKQSQNTINIRHTVNAAQKLDEAREILLHTADYLKELKTAAEKYASIKLTTQQKQMIISQLFPITENMTDRQKNTIGERIMQMQIAMACDDVSNIKDTLWGAINAYADYRTHQVIKNTKNGVENRFMSVSFDPRYMQKFIEIAMNVAA